MYDYPVKVHCPKTRKEELVYFHPMTLNGQLVVSRESFNGCDANWCQCPECSGCKIRAWEIAFPDE